MSDRKARSNSKLGLVVSELPDPPYPATTKAAGLHLRIDTQRLFRSDTWALALASNSPELRWFCLGLWTLAWEEVPCGSLPTDDVLIAARLGVSPEAFQVHRKVLMRNWWRASDDRYYHNVVTEFVLAIIEYRRAETQRKAEYRAKKLAEEAAAVAENVPRDTAGVPRVSHGTDGGVPRLSPSFDDAKKLRSKNCSVVNREVSTPVPRARDPAPAVDKSNGAHPPGNGKFAIENNSKAKPNGGAGKQVPHWSRTKSGIAASGKTVGVERREGESDDAYKDRVFAAINARLAAGAAKANRLV
jgi:hypothetical protein